jgi:hypothetical protein
MEIEFEIVVKGPGVDVSKKVDGPTALNALQLIWSPPRISEQNRSGPAKLSFGGIGGERSIGEFLSELRATNNAEKIAAIALYLQEHFGRQRVQKSEIIDSFATAGEAAPRNPTRDFQGAVTRRLIAEDPNKRGHYYVTQTGITRLRGDATVPVSTGHDIGQKSKGENARARKQVSTGGKRTRSKASSAGDGPMGQLARLKADDFFAKPKSMNEILAELETRGVHYVDTYLTQPLQTLVRRQELRRTKRAAEGSKKQVWHYSNWA